MHELVFAEEILNCVLKEVEKHGSPRVLNISLGIGCYSGIEPDSLAFCLEAITKDTLLEGAKLEFEETGPQLICQRCGRFPCGGVESTICPQCGGEAIYSPGTDLYIRNIEIDDNQN